MNKMDEAIISARIKMAKAAENFVEDETGDFAQYALLIIIVVAIAGIVSNALTGWVENVMDSLTSFTAS